MPLQNRKPIGVILVLFYAVAILISYPLWALRNPYPMVLGLPFWHYWWPVILAIVVFCVHCFVAYRFFPEPPKELDQILAPKESE